MEWFIFALGAAVFFSVYYIMLKRNVHHEYILEYLFLYMCCIFLMLLPFIQKVNFSLQPVTYMLVYIDALFLTLFFVFTTYTYKHMEISKVGPLGNLTLILTTLVGVVVFKEDFQLKYLFGVLLMIVGAYILEVGIKWEKWKQLEAQLKNKYLRYASLGVISSAIAFTLDKILLSPQIIGLHIVPIDVLTQQFLTRGFILLNFSILACFFKSRVGIKHGITTKGWAILFAAAVYNVGNMLYYKAMATGFISRVVPVLSLSSLFIVVMGGEMFHETHINQKMIACMVMILAAYLLVS